MAENFPVPDFLQNVDVETLHKRMLDTMPGDIDKSQGQTAWDYTRPTAIEIAVALEQVLPEALKLIWPAYSYGRYLDNHAKSRGVSPRKSPVAASGQVTAGGKAGTKIEKGSVFSTESINGIPSVEYIATGSATIPAAGTVTVDIQCTQTGVIGNAAAGAVTVMVTKINGVTSLTNLKAITGGTGEEDDGSFRQRIEEYDESQGSSFVGNVSDYKRWAKSVAGVGEAVVIPAQDDSGVITVIVTDSNGEPANSTLCDSIYQFIMQPDNPAARLAPINASLSVLPPQTVYINISATVELAGSSTLDAVKAAYIDALALYLQTATEEKEVKYSRIASILSAVPGVNDYKDVKLNGGVENIKITNVQLPVVSAGTLTLTAGTV